jgi:2-methylcitrate dehydratase
MKSVAEQWAQYALSLKWEEIPKEVVHQAKKLYLDTLACAVGGYDSEVVKVLHRVAEGDLRGSQEATLIGSGTRTTSLNALLINGAMVRYLDANDVSVGGAHDSEVIPAVLAVGERESASGKEILLSSIIGYELAARFMLAVQGGGSVGAYFKMEKKGWNGDLRAGFVMPAVFGRLLGLNSEQIANAIGIAGSRSFLLGIIDAAEEENTLAKNIRFPFTAHMALFTTYMAGKGLTGPRRVIEGERGFKQSFCGDLDLEKMVAFDDGWMIMQAGTKAFCACYSTHGQLRATVDLAKEIDLKPEQVEAIKIVTSPRSFWHTGNPDTRRRVYNKETADHSSYYVNAIAILERAVGPEHYTPTLYQNPRVLDLMDRITIEADDRYTAIYPGSRVEILTKDGTLYIKEVKHPRGHRLNPMDDSEIEEKFHQMARPYMDKGQRREIIAAVYEMDCLDNIGKLLELFRFRK